jgi:hypothetical protein
LRRNECRFASESVAISAEYALEAAVERYQAFKQRFGAARLPRV